MSTLEQRLAALEAKVTHRGKLGYENTAPVRNVMAGTSIKYRVPANFNGIVNISHPLGLSPTWFQQGTSHSLVTILDRIPAATQSLRKKWTPKSIQLYVTSTASVPETVTIILGT